MTLDGVQPIQQPCAGVILQRAQTVQPQPLQRLGSVTHTALQRTPVPVPVPTPAGIGHSVGHGTIIAGPRAIQPTAVFVKPAQAWWAYFGYGNAGVGF